MNISVTFPNLDQALRAGAYGARVFGNVPFFGPGANQMGALAGFVRLLGQMGSFGRILTGLSAAIAAITALSFRTARILTGTGLGGLMMGGTAGQGLQAGILGGTLGLSMEQMSGIGERLGGQNRAGRLLQAIDQIRSYTRWEDALRYARARGIEELSGLWFLEGKQMMRLRQMARAQEGIFGPGAIAQAVQFNFEVAAFRQQLDTLVAGIGSVVLPGVTAVLKTINDWATALGGGGAGKGASAGGAGASGAYFSGPGVFGGGARTQGALPHALRGQTLSEALARGNVSLGALVP